MGKYQNFTIPKADFNVPKKNHPWIYTDDTAFKNPLKTLAINQSHGNK